MSEIVVDFGLRGILLASYQPLVTTLKWCLQEPKTNEARIQETYLLITNKDALYLPYLFPKLCLFLVSDGGREREAPTTKL